MTDTEVQRIVMAANDKTDEATGKAKEAAGKITGDENLENEGETQQNVARAKNSVEDATRKAGDAVKDLAAATAVHDEGGVDDVTSLVFEHGHQRRNRSRRPGIGRIGLTVPASCREYFRAL
ncbi:MAG: CsbD family protein [Streptosporangiales bacterium]